MFVNLSLFLFVWVLSWLIGSLINVWSWKKCKKPLAPESKSALRLVLFIISTHQEQDLWCCFLLVKLRLIGCLFFCCRLIISNVDFNNCKIFYFFVQRQGNSFLRSCSMTFFRDFLPAINWCKFITVASAVTVTVTVNTLLLVLICLKKFFLPDYLASS